MSNKMAVEAHLGVWQSLVKRVLAAFFLVACISYKLQQASGVCLVGTCYSVVTYPL